MGPLATFISELLVEIEIFVQDNAFENVVYEICGNFSKKEESSPYIPIF